MFTVRKYLKIDTILIKFTRHFIGNANLRPFFDNNSGHVAVIFGLCLVPIITAVGISVDYSSAISAKSKIQAGLDAAALAAGRTLQTSGQESEASAAAIKIFDATVDKAINAALNVDGIDASTGNIDLTGTANVPTAFMSIVGIDSIKVAASTQAQLAIGGEGEKPIEISMMLDVTGSMSGSKISDMKVAAKDLIQIVLQSNEVTPEKTRVALVPFSESVNVRSYAPQATNSAASKTMTSGKKGKGKEKTWKVAKDCVTERTGDEAFTDAAPNGQNKVGTMYTSNGSCNPKNEIIPLTDDQSALEKAIDAFTATGYTAGHLGTAWAWYTLSPNWKNVWPKNSRPNDYNPESVTKIAILMTDGEYNTEYKDGISTRDLGKGSQSPNGSSDTQADKLCENMKAPGITVYTIGFALNNSKAKSTMKDCATSEEHYFLAEDGEKLREVFREIAFQIAKLRISK
ncbi:MAG: vWA domain-containing protein [Methyloligellaceae bacterium]